ncbi:MAG: hypothetical protein ACI9KE_006217 [Polyangiales bacterium]|jgi:hypothetical protein
MDEPARFLVGAPGRVVNRVPSTHAHTTSRSNYMPLRFVVPLALLGFSACMDDFSVDESDASTDVGVQQDVNGDDAGDAGLVDSATPDDAMLDAGGSPDDSGAFAECPPPWLYYVVQSEAEPTFVARYSITDESTTRCAKLDGEGSITELASSALVISPDRMVIAGPDQLQMLNLRTDIIEWSIPTALPFTAVGFASLFSVDSTSFGVGWDRDVPNLGAVSIRNISDGAIRMELPDVTWRDATAAPERDGDLWIVGRSRTSTIVAQRYVVGSQSPIDELETAGERVSTVGQRLVIDIGGSYRLYDLAEDGPAFIDTVVLPSAECRLIDVVGHPFRDGVVFVGCGEDGRIRSVRAHLRGDGSYEAVEGSVLFEETVLSLSLYEGV